MSGKPIKDEIPFEPFQRWLNERMTYHQACYEKERRWTPDLNPLGPVARMLEEIGWEDSDTTARKLYRWRMGTSDCRPEGKSGPRISGTPRKRGLPRAEVEDALHTAGVDFYELYAQFAHERNGEPEPEAWCPACQSHVMTEPVGSKHVCIWCDWEISDGHMNGSEEMAA